MSLAALEMKPVSRWLFGIGEPTRLAILKLLAGGAKNVSEVSRLLDLEVTSASSHLGVLRTYGLVADQKVGRNVYYTIVDGAVEGSSLVLRHAASGAELILPVKGR